MEKTPRYADLREFYGDDEHLKRSELDPDPITQFESWFQEAQKAGVVEPTAMTLATVSKEGNPSARTVLLKGIENGYLVFYTNYKSKKGRELDANPRAALTFLWKEIERQVRVEGFVQKVDAKSSEEYFQSRPRESQISAHASEQSEVVPDRNYLLERFRRVEKEFEGYEKLPLPKDWGGYLLKPEYFEFWQGRMNRLHDRFSYTLVSGEWQIRRLAP